MPKTTTIPAHISRFIARSAIAASEDLRATDRAYLYDAAAALLTGQEREQAKLVAYTLREAERQQMQFINLISTPPHQ